MKKAIIFQIFLLLVKFNLAQQQSQTQQQPLIKKVDKELNSSASLKSTTIDEGTNDPENTGHKKIIINGKTYYVKNEENIKIEFIPNK